MHLSEAMFFFNFVNHCNQTCQTDKSIKSEKYLCTQESCSNVNLKKKMDKTELNSLYSSFSPLMRSIPSVLIHVVLF